MLLVVSNLVAGATNKYAPVAVKGLSVTTHTLRLEDEKVWVHIYQAATPGLNLVNLHDNENTAAEVAREYISQNGGRLVELRHGRGRYVIIRRGDSRAQFDPNRMFSPGGLRKSLNHFADLTEANVKIGSVFSKSVLELINVQSNGIVVAIHNNTDGKLTIDDFKPGGWYGPDTEDVHKSNRQDHDDFFFTNHQPIYEALAGLNYNVALMAKSTPDRGGLGAYVQKHSGIYINLEAQHGHKKQQRKMLDDLGRLLAPYQQGITGTD
jgi:hypothetical protein